MELSAFKTPGGGSQLKFAINLRLFNDGFLYPPSNQLKLKVEETVPNHNCDGWHLLAEAELTNFPTAVLFAQEFLGMSTRPPCFLYYHESLQRMDLKFRNQLVTSMCSLNDDLWY